MHRRLVASALVLLALVTAAPAQAAHRTLFTLVGHGWGHGIGLSQWGDYGFAAHGWGYRAILKHYYTGVAFDSLPPGEAVRVLMTSGVPGMRFTADAPVTVVAEGDGSSHPLPAGTYRVEPGPADGKQRVWSVAQSAYVLAGLAGPVRVVPGSSPLRLDTPTFNGFDDKHWHGSLRTIRTGSTVEVVNIVSVDNYARDIIPCEISASWPTASQKAMAVAARSYAVANLSPAGDFDAYADTRSQNYCPIEREAAASDAASAATSRQIMTYHGSPIVAYYSASSGGRTSTTTASWGSAVNPPYLVPVNDPYDGAGGLNPNHTWARRVFDPRTLATRLGTGGTVAWVEHHIDGPSRRVLSVTLHKPSGATVVRSSSQLSSELSLRSTYFRLLGLTLRAPFSARPGQAFAVSGRVWPKAASAVALQGRFDGGRWFILVKRVRLDADGHFIVWRRHNRTIHFRLVRRNAVSPVIAVTIGSTQPMRAVVR
jgi:stage II sporulation protein D